MKKFTLALDASQIAAYLECPLSWGYRYQEHLSRISTKATALDKGSLVHLLCDLYYKLRGMNPKVDQFVHANACIDLFKKLKVNFNLSKEEIVFICSRFLQYVTSTYGSDYRPVVKNGIPAVELGFSKLLYEDDDYLFVVEGRIDMLAIINGETIFVDHKTQGKVQELYKFSPQFLTYAWATGLSKGIINYIGLQDTLVDKSFRRQLISFPKWKINEWKKKMMTIFSSISSTILYGSGFERNENSCQGKFGWPCQFTMLCETENINIQQGLKEQFYEIKIWKPWELGEKNAFSM